MKKLQELGSAYLPEELLIQIMRFLPVKSLLVFRSVCKSFRSIIDDNPHFVSLHLRSLPDNLHQTLTLFHRCFGWTSRYEIRESNGLALHAVLYPLPQMPLRAPFSILMLAESYKQSRILTGSVDGLLLLTPTNGSRSRSEVGILWNPSVRKTRRIPLPDPLSKSNPNYRLTKGTGLVGLAYDSSCRDYKVLCISYREQLRPSGVWVYGLETRSWTAVDMEKSGMCTLPAESRSQRPFFFGGALLWIEACGNTSSTEYNILRMVRFEVGTCKFSYYANLPLSAEKHRMMESRLVSLDGGSTLGLCGLDGHDLVSVWALDDGDAAGLWVRRCVISEYPMLSGYTSACFRVSKDEELMWMYRFGKTLKVFTYNFRTHHCQQRQISPSASILYEGEHCAYIQSLVKL